MRDLDASYDVLDLGSKTVIRSSSLVPAGRCDPLCDPAPRAEPARPSQHPDYRKFPIVNSKTSGSSLGWASSGMPHSNRSGPIGENQRNPKPTDLRRPSVSDSSGRKHGSNLIDTAAFLRCSPEQ